ncbi:hypothetical protein D9758_012153 [Tetrapyrgos nigripes]|uniref:Uncharacterized protein n=1 Tax=Tetrapyrgos nigripes TaxID=182062 RepID=A0A8H5FL79_9AGAR|nr:hypothetical protein D9758_012153 [Tetrapyrgos nigripes]
MNPSFFDHPFPQTTTTRKLVSPKTSQTLLDRGISEPISGTVRLEAQPGLPAPLHHSPAQRSPNPLSVNQSSPDMAISHYNSPNSSSRIVTNGKSLTPVDAAGDPDAHDFHSSIPSLHTTNSTTTTNFPPSIHDTLQSNSSKTPDPDALRNILSPIVLRNANSRLQQIRNGNGEGERQLENVKRTLSDDVLHNFAATMYKAQSQLRERLQEKSRRLAPTEPRSIRHRSRSGINWGTLSHAPDLRNGHSHAETSISGGSYQPTGAVRDGHRHVNGHTHPYAYQENQLGPSKRRSRTRTSSNASISPHIPSAPIPSTSAVTGEHIPVDQDWDIAIQSVDDPLPGKLTEHGVEAVSTTSESRGQIPTAEQTALEPPDVPGIWSFKVALPEPGILKWEFLLDPTTVDKWHLHPTPTTYDNLMESQPRLALHLLCLDSEALPSSRMVENEAEKMCAPWPTQGTLIIEVNKKQEYGKTILPNHLGPNASAFDITKMVHPGHNTLCCIQLAPMSCIFAIHAGVVGPPPDMSHLSQFVDKLAVQSNDSQAPSADVAFHPLQKIS